MAQSFGTSSSDSESPGTEPRVAIRYLAPSALNGLGRASYTAETRARVTQAFDVILHDGRQGFAKRPAKEQLEANGMALVSDFQSSVHGELDNIENPLMYRSDNAQESAVSVSTREVYFAECENLLRGLTGADVAFAISHAVRSGKSNKHASGVEYLTAYATFAHTDYTEEILPGAWKMLTKRGVPEAQARKMRVAFFNVWQPTRVPVQQYPLALLDWQSVDPCDVVSVTLGYDVTPKAGEQVSPPIGQLVHNPGHRWYFFPDMQTNEALVFTQVDSRPGFPKHSFHTAVRHSTVPDPVERQSVEVRVLCGFLARGDAPGGGAPASAL